MVELKKKLEEESALVTSLEDARKKLVRESEVNEERLKRLTDDNERLTKSRKKLQSEVDDLTVALDNQRSQLLALEKKQKRFDQSLLEEKSTAEKYDAALLFKLHVTDDPLKSVEKLSYIILRHHLSRECLIILINCLSRLAAEKDNCDRENREKETKILNLIRELDESNKRVAAMEAARVQQQSELDDLISSKDDVGKNVSCMLNHIRMSMCSIHFIWHFMSLMLCM